MILTEIQIDVVEEFTKACTKNSKREIGFKWLEKNLSFTNAKLWILDIKTTSIEIITKNIYTIIDKVEKFLKLVSSKYVLNDLGSYYDLVALTSLVKKENKV